MRNHPGSDTLHRASPLRLALAIAGIASPLFFSPCAAQVTDLDIWIDPNFDGLPGPSSGVCADVRSFMDSVAVYIDAHEFVWTNFLFYVSFGDSAGPSYISTDTSDVRLRLDIYGNEFLEDNFSFPNVVGFGGFSFPEQSGAQKLGTLFFKPTQLPGTASIRPIVDPNENSVSIFTQLGNGTSYGTFEDGMVGGVPVKFCGIDQCPSEVTIAPREPLLAVGDSLPFAATARWWDGWTQDFTTSVYWSSSDSSVATVDASGLARGVGIGTAVIHAIGCPVQDSTMIEVVEVVPPFVQSLEVSPATAQVPKGMTVALSVLGIYSDGSEQDFTSQVLWTSEDSVIATIDPTGIATGVQIGATTLEARLDEITASSTVTVVEELRVMRPTMGASWFVGALEQIEWTAPGPVDLEWSIDDGVTFAPIQEGVAAEEYLLRVPNPAAVSARVRVRVVLDSLAFLSLSEPFGVLGEIEASSFEAIETADARVRLSWATNPAPPVIAGYRLERALGDGPFTPLHASIIDGLSFVDEAPVAGATYRLIGVNGWNEESVLASTALETILLGGREIAVVPNPSPQGQTTIVFRDPGAARARGAQLSASIIVIHDVAGRRVRTISSPASASTAVLRVEWDGRDENGELVAPGHYVVELRSGEARIATSRVTVVR